MKVIIKHPNQDPEVREISNTLKALQEAVDGHIECITVSNRLVIIVDEDGRRKGKEYNFSLANSSIVGTAVICGVSGDEFSSVTPLQIAQTKCFLNQ